MELSHGQNAYTYKPLSDQLHPIRLLKLHKAENFQDKIYCNLWETTLYANVEFEALSYTWGNTPVDEMRFMYLRDYGEGRSEDVNKDYQFWIGRNLEQALRYLRFADRDRILWIDKICINQSDEGEKGKQIGQMRLIYIHARRVVLWMGEEGDANMALNHIRRLESAFEVDSHRRKTMFNGMSAEEVEKNADSLDPEGIVVFLMPFLLDGYDREWCACDDLLNREWWTRSWVLQEVIHTGDVLVYIGLMEISLDDICQRLENYRSFKTLKKTRQFLLQNAEPNAITTIPPPQTNFDSWIKGAGSLEATVSTMLTLRQQARAATTAPDREVWRPTLGRTLLGVRDQQATKEKDKIWAFVGMSQHNYDLVSEVHYESLSWQELYIKVTHNLLQNSLLVLLWVESPSRGMEDSVLPSWVPDYTQRQTYVSRAMVSTSHLFDADKSFPIIEQEPRRLLLSIHKGNGRELVIRGIIVGFVKETKLATIADDPTYGGCDTRVMLFRYERQQQGALCHYPSRDPIKQRSLQQSPGQTHWNNATIRNTSWGPLNASWGDLIVVSPGSKIPLVLRQTEAAYKLVGGCWLIDRELQDLTNLRDDPGFSNVMFGSVCSNMDNIVEVEEFVLC